MGKGVMRGLTTVFGGSGFIGAQIVRALARRGRRVRVAVRRPGLAHALPLLGDVGQIEIVQANVRDDDSVARALDGAEAAVNVVGVLFETGRQKFETVHVGGAARIAAAARRAGAADLVHISAIGADPSSRSAYARTKAAGEAAVRAAFPEASVLRPSVVFGPEDGFFNRFASLAMRAPVLPLIGGGHTLFQPVYVGDVAAAVVAVLAKPEAQGASFELGGPQTYSFVALMRLMLETIGRKRPMLDVPFGLARLMGAAGDVMASTGLLVPPITSDQVEMLRADNVVGPGVAGLAQLGVSPTAVEAIIPTYLWRYRAGGQYAEDLAAAAAR